MPAPHDEFTGVPLERLLSGLDLPLAQALGRALAGQDISVNEGVALLGATGRELLALISAADELRRRQVGERVTYVVNRNINFTNVCIKRCGFCAFSRDYQAEEGYFLPLSEVVRRAKEAWEFGATEVCIQAGLPPHMQGDLYIRICEAVKAEVPEIHIHGFSPEEVLYGALRSRCSVKKYLQALQAAGVGSLPGTAAEILDQGLRDRVSRGRISARRWIEVITTAHELGIPTTCTMMYGYLETPEQVARHLALLRDIQRSTGGFTEFVPLSFVHTEAPMVKHGLVAGVRPGPSGLEVLRVHAVARLMLGNWIPNLQVAWVKEGPRLGQIILSAGANDLGGTLINESISTAAGAQNGQLMRPAEFRRLIRAAGRIPAERSTTYQIRRVFDRPSQDPSEALDQLDGAGAERFGCYAQLTRMERFRYRQAQASGEGGE